MAYVLLQHGPAWGLPSACYDCIRIHVYLQLSSVPYTTCDCLNQPDSEKLPALEYDRDVAYTGGVEGGIIPYLRDFKGIDLDASLLDNEKNEMNAYLNLIEGSLTDASLFSFWMEDSNRQFSEEGYLYGVPYILKKILSWKRHRAVQKYFSSKFAIEKSSPISESVYEKARQCYSVLSSRLGNNASFFSERFSSLDVALFAHLILHSYAPLPNNVLKKEMEKFPNLMKFLTNLEQKINFENFENIESGVPPFTRIPPKIPAREEESKEKKDKKLMKQRARWFLLAQASTIILYFVFSTVMIEFGNGVDDDMDEDEDMDGENGF